MANSDNQQMSPDEVQQAIQAHQTAIESYGGIVLKSAAGLHALLLVLQSKGALSVAEVEQLANILAAQYVAEANHAPKR